MRLKLLDGLKVIQVGGSVSVAFCGKLLADLGADVIMIEPPGKGNDTRRIPPFYENLPGLERSVLHNWLNSNKRGITLHLQDQEDKKIFFDLIRQADLLIEGYKNRYSVSQSLNCQELKGLNPQATIVSITPFGKHGPYANYHSNELILFSMSGVAFYLSSPVDDPPNTPPRKNPCHQVSLVAGLVAANAALWGVFAGARKKKGMIVDVSQWEAFANLLFEQTGYYSDGLLASGRKRDPKAGIAVAGGLIWCLPCADGWVLISPREDHQFRRWSEVMGSPEWTLKEKFSSAQHRKEHAWEVYKHSADWSIHQKKANVFKMAQEKKVPCFPVSLISDLPKMEQLDHRAFWVDLDHPVIRGFKYPGLPMKTNTESVPSRGAPVLGEHTFEVCQKLKTISPNMRGRSGLDLSEVKGVQRMTPNALSGVRVVDFSWVVAGPFCTKLLGLMGAEVIKIESSTRPQYKDRGAWFLILNNSKKSCTINLAADEGRELVKKLVARSDMVVENFSTGVMERLGLGYSELCKIKEDIIFISSSGLGRTGPGKDYLAYGSLLQGLSGWTSLFNKANPNMEAMGVFPAWTDPNTALWELLAILTALYHRARTGKGLYVDLSMLESTITLMPEPLLDFIANGRHAIAGASCSDTNAFPHGYYPCKENDTWIAISVSNQSEWKGLCKIMGDPSWCHAEGLDSSAHRLQNQEQIDKHLSEWTVQFPMQELFERLQSAGIPAGPCYNIERLIGDPHFKLRGLFARLDLSKGKTQITTTLPWQHEEEKDWKGDLFKPPDLGEHNEYVFLELLQLTREEFEKYRSMGVIE